MGRYIIPAVYDRGSLVIDYDEQISVSAGTSTITITSIGIMLSAKPTEELRFGPYGTIQLGDKADRIYLDYDNNVIVGTSYTVGSVAAFTNLGTALTTANKTLVCKNDGSGSKKFAITLLPHFSYKYNTFQVFSTPTGSDLDFPTGSIDGRHDVALSAYSKAAPVTASPSSVSLGGTITLSVAQTEDRFVYDFAYSFDGSTWDTPAGISGKKDPGSYVFDTSADTKFMSFFETATTTKKCTFRARAYSYSAQSTVVGESLAYVDITPGGAAPVISSVTVSHYSSNSVVSGWGVYTQGYSYADISAAYTLGGGAKLKSFKITCGGTEVYNKSTAPTGAVRSGLLNTSGSVSIVVEITDSRGAKATKTEKITVYPYSKPVISSAEALRYDTDPTKESYSNGINASAKAKATYSSVNAKNACTISCQIKVAGAATYISAVRNIENGKNFAKINYSKSGSSYIDLPLDTTKSYVVTIYATDSLTNAANANKLDILLASKGVTLHAPDGGNGLGIGQFCSIDGALEISYKTYFYNDVVLPSSMYGTEAPSAAATVGQIYFQIVD